MNNDRKYPKNNILLKSYDIPYPYYESSVSHMPIIFPLNIPYPVNP